MQFFFYGTLLAGGWNPVAKALHRKLGAGRAATVRGRLHVLPDPAGWYPALVADPAGGIVHGMVHAAGAGFSAEDLAALDAYEGFDPARPEVSDYVRRPIPVICESGGLSAQAYLYSAPLPAGARPVPGGDFRAYLAQHGLPEYREPAKDGA